MKFVTAALVSGLVLIACGSSAPGRATTAEISNVDPSAAAGIRIAWVGHAVGDRATKVEDRTMTAVVVAAPGKEVEVVTVDHLEETREVLVADGGVLTKLKVSHKKRRTTETMLGNAREKPTPTLGKAYLVWREGGELKVTLEDGNAPSAEEVSVVTKGNRSVGKADAVETFIAGRTWNLGEEVALDAAQLAAVGEVMSDDASNLTAMSLTLHDANDTTATFVMTLAVEGPTAEGGALTVELAGNVIVERRTGRVRAMELAGPFSGTAGKARLEISGTMSTKAVYTY